MTKRNLKVINFISGKGGSGKTTVAIAVSKLLTDIGYRCLLIDFDLATNGCSYFFSSYFDRSTKGILELLDEQKNNLNAIATLSPELPLAISNKDKLYFVASQAELNVKRIKEFSQNKKYLTEGILQPLLEWATKENIHYILIDCQAGYSVGVLAAVELANLAIIVTEPDPISNDAADNLLVQLGSPLLSKRRYLVNKLDIREIDDYRQASNIFQSLNRLPPLPHDSSIRHAFNKRRMPIDINQPSPLLFALFETLKEILVDESEQTRILSYQEKQISILFEEYEKNLQSLTEKKRNLEQVQSQLKTRDLRWRFNLIRNLLYLSVTFSCLLTIRQILAVISIEFLRLNQSRVDLFFWLSFIVIILLVFQKVFKLMRRLEKGAENDIKEKHISQEILEINREIDRFRSLLIAKSVDFLVNPELDQSTTDTIKVDLYKKHENR